MVFIANNLWSYLICMICITILDEPIETCELTCVDLNHANAIFLHYIFILPMLSF